jgi:hypothetical protein
VPPTKTYLDMMRSVFNSNSWHFTMCRGSQPSVIGVKCVQAINHKPIQLRLLCTGVSVSTQWTTALYSYFCCAQMSVRRQLITTQDTYFCFVQIYACRLRTTSPVYLLLLCIGVCSQATDHNPE